MTPITKERRGYAAYERLRGYSLRRLPMIGKGSLAILDQAFVGGSNFLIGILLARWLSPEQYGSYALAFSIFLLLSLVQQSLILEPQSVLGPAEFVDNLRGYLGSLLWLQAGLALTIGLVLGASAWIGHELGWSSHLVGALAGVAIAAPCVLLFWLFRGACYVKMSPVAAVQGSSLYCALIVGLLVLTSHRGLMSPFLAFVLMGLGALITSVFLSLRLRPSMTLRTGRTELTTIGRAHWIYGRWALASSVVTWLPWNVYYSVLGHSSLEQAGELRAIMNLFLPLGQTLTALSLLLHPMVAQRLRKQGRAAVLRQAPEIVCLYAIGSILYWAVVIPFRVPLFRILYRGQYADVSLFLPWVAFASIFWFAAFAPPITLRALQAPSMVLIIYGAASAVTLLIGIPAARAYGLRGVILGTSLSSIVALSAGIVLTRVKKFSPSDNSITQLADEVSAL